MQALHWLDAVRYADTCGFHGDNVLPAWPYRDYVLRAFRDNMPFDRFTREQLAGDLLPNATNDQKVASAYNRMNRTSAEGGLQPKEYLAKYAADRARTTSVVWLASTTGCAECHDHKFDPILSRDFYSMEAFFADIKETGLVPDRGSKAWGSLLALPSEAQKKQQADLNARLEVAKKALEEKAATLASRQPQWEKDVLAAYKAGKLNWKYQRPFAAHSENGAKLTIYNDEPVDFTYYDGGTELGERKAGGGIVIASGPNPDNETYTVSFKTGRRNVDRNGRSHRAGEQPAGRTAGTRRGSRGGYRGRCRNVGAQAEVYPGDAEQQFGSLARSSRYGRDRWRSENRLGHFRAWG